MLGDVCEEDNLLVLVNLDPKIGNALRTSAAPMFDCGCTFQSHALHMGQDGSRDNHTKQGRLVQHIDMNELMEIATIYFTDGTQSLSRKRTPGEGIAKHYIDVGARIEQDGISYSNMWPMKFSTLLDIGYGEFI